MKRIFLTLALLCLAATAFAGPQVQGQPLMSRQRIDVSANAATVWYRGHEAGQLLQHFRFRNELELGGTARWWLQPSWAFQFTASRGLESKLVMYRLGAEWHILGGN